MTEVQTQTPVTLRCVGGPRDGEYVALPAFADSLVHDTRLYRRTLMGWGYEGMTFQREVLVWDGLNQADALVILMRRFVDLLDEQRL
jgi:hypothetical protein